MIKKFKDFIDEGLLRHYNRWHNGEKRQEDKHEYVDLGLPSGLLWAKCNLGADTEVDAGGYYAWGETEEKDSYNWENYKFGDYDNLTKYNEKDKLTTLEPEDDAVHVNWGGKWRMPTEDDYKELRRYAVRSWCKINGVNGMKFSNKNNKDIYIFFPAVEKNIIASIKWCDMWTSQLNNSFESNAIYSEYTNDGFLEGTTTRKSGMTIRGVREK